jgi:hypothetical protein
MHTLNDKSFKVYYMELYETLKLKIASESDDYIITQPTEDLVKYYSNQFLSPVEFDADRKESIEHIKFIKTIPAQQREWAYQQDGDLKMECEKIVVKIPIKHNTHVNIILRLRTNYITLSPGPVFAIKGDDILFEVEIKGYQRNLDNQGAGNLILSNKSQILGHFNSKNREIEIENKKLKANLTQFINARKIKLDSDQKRIKELVNLVKIPLARKDDDVVRKIQIEKKPFVIKIKPKTLNEDYQLDSDKVVDIIKLISNQCLQFEKTPKTYDKLDEPNLRDLILANLNSIFEGQATGETFNFHGKTDIYLNIDKGNILIAECKFYKGEKVYHETIEQLLKYLTWRQNFGIIINFCKQKNFTKIIDDAEGIIKSHNSFESDFRILDKSHFISKHTLPGDNYKYVEIHHLYYNLYLN